MNTLNKLVNLLTPYVKDKTPVAESKIWQFVHEKNIFLREDHLNFLMEFGCEVQNGRVQIFKNYGGDFDFEQFARVYTQNHPDMALPNGYTYFGSTFVGEAYCIEHESGKIFTYDSGERYDLVHESIAGFLLNCFLIKDYESAFANTTARQDLDLEFFTKFRSTNENGKINEATRFEDSSGQINVDSEFYSIDRQLIKLFLPRRAMVTMSGGILDQL